MTKIRLPYGLRENALLHISQVDSGLACGCVCPRCSSPLVARKATRREHHFAHHASDSCRYATETALHLAAKDILDRLRVIRLPAVRIEFKSNRSAHEIAPAQMYEIDSVRIEQRVDGLVPDLIARIGNRDLFIEVYVTHPVDSNKLQRIRDLRVSAVEIDLSDAPRDMPMDAIAELVVNGIDNKRWIFNAREQAEYKRLMSQTLRKPTIRRGLAVHVDWCPIAVRVWRGKPYANVNDDCASCEHCLEAGSNYIQCNGHLSTLVPHRPRRPQSLEQVDG